MRKLFLVLLAIVGWTGIAHAQLTFDAAYNAGDATNTVSSITYSHTVANQPNRNLYVGCYVAGATLSTWTVTGITFDGVSMTNVTSVGTSQTDNIYISVFKLLGDTNVHTGAHNVIATYSGTPDGYQGCASISFYGADTTNGNRTASTASSGSTPTGGPSASPTSAVNDIVVDFAGFVYEGATTYTAGGSQSEQTVVLKAATRLQLGVSTLAGSASSTSMSWAVNPSNWTQNSYITFAVIPAAAAATGPKPGSLPQMGVGR